VNAAVNLQRLAACAHVAQTAAQRYTLPGSKPQTLAAWDYRIDAPVSAAAR